MKPVLKCFARYLASTMVLPLLALDKIAAFGGSDAVFLALSQLLSLLPGKSGCYIRAAFYRHALTRCSTDLFVGFTTLFYQRNTAIGAGVYIGPQCNIGACRIGDDTLIASGVHIMSGTNQHRFEDLHTPIRDQGGEFTQISIGRDCWVGNGALVMADIGDHCVIGAGSVVTRPIPDYAIAVGNPARVVRSRLNDAGASGDQAANA